MNKGWLRDFTKRNLPHSAHRFARRLIYGQRKRAIRSQLEFASAPDRAEASSFQSTVNPDNVLEELGARYQPTKRLHNYLPYYWLHFRDIRLDVERVLEIGVQTDRSIRMWEEFFPNAVIHGIDIDPECRKFEGGRRKIHIGDQSDRQFLAEVVARVGGAFDVIIDDGSHVVEHQLISFDYLFPKMSDHGVYVVEDTGGVVGDESLITLTSLMGLVNAVMYWPEGFRSEDWLYLSEFPREALWADRNVTGIAVYRWLVFISRGHNPGDNPYLLALHDLDEPRPVH